MISHLAIFWINGVVMIDLKTIRFVCILGAVSVSFSACSLREPDHFSTEKLRVEVEVVEHDLGVADLSEASLQTLARHYDKHGDGAMELTLTYDPRSKTNTAMHASQKISEIAEILRREGVRDMNLNILPVNSASPSRLMVSYTGYNALAPKDCELMPGIAGREVNAEDSYKMGCSVDTMFARQIARPKDLVGQRNSAKTDGRRVANQLELYRSGAANSSLEGESSTGE